MRNCLKKSINKCSEKIDLDITVKFKSSCFFQFFLMKNIDKSQEFKSHVFEDTNFKKFVEELDYYSGLKMDDLEFAVGKMNESYEALINRIVSLKYSFDDPFETNHTLVDRLDSNTIKIFN